MSSKHHHPCGHAHGRRRWFRRRITHQRLRIHRDVPHPKPCEYQLTHLPIRKKDTVLTLIYHCQDGLVGFNEADTQDCGIELAEQWMAIYDIDRVAGTV